MGRSILWRSSGATDVGSVRRHNEDSFLDRPEVGLWAVADGMGGHDNGALASQSIVQALETVSTPTTAGAFLAEVEGHLITVNADLRREATRLGPHGLIGSTVVVLLLYGGHFACVWAGDSRIYRMRNGVLSQITRDHSYVQMLVDSGAITPEEAHHHPKGNVITRAVGIGDPLELDLRQGAVEPGDQFLLCSDGLTKMLEEHEVAAMLATAPDGEAAQMLVDEACRRGAIDNVTVVEVRTMAAD